ncbi:hypothetical protein EFN38_00115 [Leuconostoc mesenteroides]|nr:hypothetical protein [Leuconostoc mesenteroides]
MVQQRKNQSCQSKNKSSLISPALDEKYSELLTYEQEENLLFNIETDSENDLFYSMSNIDNK